MKGFSWQIKMMMALKLIKVWMQNFKEKCLKNKNIWINKFSYKFEINLLKKNFSN